MLHINVTDGETGPRSGDVAVTKTDFGTGQWELRNSPTELENANLVSGSGEKIGKTANVAKWEVELMNTWPWRLFQGSMFYVRESCYWLPLRGHHKSETISENNKPSCWHI